VPLPGLAGRLISRPLYALQVTSEEKKTLTAQIEGVARQGGAALAAEPSVRSLPASRGSRVPGSRFWASNNSMEPTWPAGSRGQLPLIDSGLAAGVSYSRDEVLRAAGSARAASFLPKLLCPRRPGGSSRGR
jgi:hypothetical protein